MQLIDFLGWFPVEKIYLLLEKIRIRRLSKKFSHCGKEIVISPGLYVECPERLTLADEVSFGPSVRIMGIGGVSVGRGTMIASGVYILTTAHDSNAPLMRKTGLHKPVFIGEDVWIGAGAIILPGVEICDHAIVGAGAVVTHNVAEKKVVIGIPARVIRERQVVETVSGDKDE
ncbi:DapH/DapD/GlmU-related protein [Anabaena sp. AL93]|jgi:maltose O-acetyltransferase|uniref:acyltransferase n=1 Tax=Anabaena sp. AL93 TaxID=1678133 RepID=UPI0025B7BDA0|nr:DapH/DapD/GlmU-related protein [Anabaena sp. AL93]